MPNVQPIPQGYHALTPHLVVKDGLKAIEFYTKVFGATEVDRMMMPDGKTLAHAELKIGDSPFMLGEESPQWNALSPQSLKGSPVTLHLYVKDVDAVFDQAVKAGAKSDMPVSNQFWGDRYGTVVDPFGHKWGIATHIEDVSPQEMEKRANKLFAATPA